MIFMTRKWMKLTGLSVAIGILIIVIIVVLVTKSDNTTPHGVPVTAAKGAIVSNGGPCADIGMKILEKHGNAIDSMIATMLCDGVTTMNNMGIGGGFIATIYIKSTNKAYTLNARETAPANSFENMYAANQTLAQVGGLSVAVPGELRGYWEMHQKFGKAPWEELFHPTVELCRNGVPINQHIAENILQRTKEIKESPTLYALLKKPDGSLPVEGDKVKLPKLGETLALIAKNGPDVLYNGSLSQLLIDDINNDGGDMTLEDLANYSVRWEEPVEIKLKNDSLTMYSVPAPASGPVLAHILSLVDGLLTAPNPDDNNNNNIVSDKSTRVNLPLADDIQQFIPNERDTFIITEAFKHAYAERSAIGDPHFHNISEVLERIMDQNLIRHVQTKLNISETSTKPEFYGANYFTEDHGTANMVVLAPNGDTVVTTSTINLIFGSRLVSKNTGIILNDEMDDFSSRGGANFFGIPPSQSNFITPGARPQSSMCPTIFVNSVTGETELAVGAAGGTRITTATALVALRALWYDMGIKEAIHMKRFHHQLLPMVWIYDPGMPKEMINYMESRGHTTKMGRKIESCVTAVLKRGSLLEGSSDYRRPGNVSYFVA